VGYFKGKEMKPEEIFKEKVKESDEKWCSCKTYIIHVVLPANIPIFCLAGSYPIINCSDAYNTVLWSKQVLFSQ